MKDLAEVERLLSQAISALGEIPPIIKEIPELSTKETKIAIGSAIYDLMELRELIYRLSPELKSPPNKTDGSCT